MSEWIMKQIRDVANFHRGISWSSEQEIHEPTPTSVPVLRISNVQKTLNVSDILYLRGISDGQRLRFAATKNWLLMVGSNGNPARVGDTVIIDHDSEFLFASFLVGVEPRTGNGVDPRYMLYLFNSQSVRKAIDDSIKGTTGLRNISLGDVAACTFSCPDLSEQLKIAKILATLDNLIEKTEALVAKYQAVKQGVMHDLFTRGVDEHGHLRPSQVEAPHLYTASPLGPIPKAWDLVQAKSLCAEITKGATPAQLSDREGDGFKPFIRVQNLTFDGTLAFDGDQLFVPHDVHLSQLGRSRVFPGDVLMNLVGPPLGKVSRVPANYSEWNINQAIAIFRALDPKDSGWLLYYLLTQKSYIWLLSRAKKTSGQMNLTLEMCRQLPVPMPQRAAEKTLIVSALSNLDHRIDSEVLGLKKYRLLKAGLMQDLLTGKVRVQVDPAEEAAHA